MWRHLGSNGVRKARCTVAVGFPISYSNFCHLLTRELTGIVYYVCTDDAARYQASA